MGDLRLPCAKGRPPPIPQFPTDSRNDESSPLAGGAAQDRRPQPGSKRPFRVQRLAAPRGAASATKSGARVKVVLIRPCAVSLAEAPTHAGQWRATWPRNARRTGQESVIRQCSTLAVVCMRQLAICRLHRDLGHLPEWRLEHLYSGLDSPQFASDLVRARESAKAFALAHKGRLAERIGAGRRRHGADDWRI